MVGLHLAVLPNRRFPLQSGGSSPGIVHLALSGGGQIMPMHNLASLGGAALLPLPFAANAVPAERESDGPAVGLGDLVTDVACAASGDAAVMRDGNNRSRQLT